MHNMCFFLTTEQIRQRTKTVTRRLGWKFLKPGERFRAVRKAQGLKKGEKIEVLAVLECVSNVQEWLYEIIEYPVRGARAEVSLEGFQCMPEQNFVSMFCKHMDCTPSTIVNRIEFKYVELGA